MEQYPHQNRPPLFEEILAQDTAALFKFSLFFGFAKRPFLVTD